jgi:hypothetical protein
MDVYVYSALFLQLINFVNNRIHNSNPSLLIRVATEGFNLQKVNVKVHKR